jgi:SAM-dependent methyltransferase
LPDTGSETGAEFTGERVIPGLVDIDLLNEHLARYRFANQVIGAHGREVHVLDAGCGSGYGTAELSHAASITAADLAAEAVGYARDNFARPGVRFLQAACEALPFSAASFDVVVAFEVIEHLDRWRELLAEAHRVLTPSGILLVSTPNRDYYEESRGDAGPNPFHRHEFSCEEFLQALGVKFPHVRIWTQNHAGAIVFSPRDPTRAITDVSGQTDQEGAHFFLAICSESPIAANEAFIWLPSSANVLRERERHIAKLNGELGKKNAWLQENIEARSQLFIELEHQNRWAASLNEGVRSRDVRIDQLQRELEERLVWIADLESQIAGAQTEIERVNAELVERTRWAQKLERVATSKWARAGAKLGLGPGIDGGK